MSVASLERISVPVIAMRPPNPDPSVMVGASLASPLGPKVAIGASLALVEGMPPLALVAHLDPDTAIQLAAKITVAAAEVLEAQGMGGTA